MQSTTQAINEKSAAPATQDPDFSAIKTKMKATWSDGDYDFFSRYMAEGAKLVIGDWPAVKDEKLLDVACGSGQTAILYALNGVDVTGIDIAENSIEAAIERAALDGAQVGFKVGDAENIDFDDGSFDVVVSMFGAMFAPRPEQVVEEFSRVCRSGGRLHMANWTPQGMVGLMFKIIGRYVAPPGVASPLLWGDEETVTKRLSESFTDIKLIRKPYPKWIYPFDAAELVNFFRTYYGPVKRAFGALDEKNQLSLHQELIQNFAAHNVATDGTLDLQGEYLDVSAVRK